MSKKFKFLSIEMTLDSLYSRPSIAEKCQFFIEVRDVLAINLVIDDRIIYIDETRLSSDSRWDSSQRTSERS